MIDLSHRPHSEKIEYIRAVLPALNEMRRRTGLPHRILVDEAHYFLHDADAAQLLDFEANGYTVVTYRASRLPKELLAATDVMIVTRESNPAEVEAVRHSCSKCSGVDRSWWSILGHVRLGQAVALPITDEAGGDLRLFTMAPRLTPHVRHREKYVDVPVSDQKAFVFAANGHIPGSRARTLRQFVSMLEDSSHAHLDGYLRRGDFSRWIADVFGDYPMAAELRSLEARYRADRSEETIPDLVGAIRTRYDLMDEDAEARAEPQCSMSA